ncbi:MAG TPA: hypothetical protein VMW80_04640, partial [Candidatus Dormibacteraeota bacterium]|nr:hypothetical protein [Candidatus Dormibacteraeota bacterium]
QPYQARAAPPSSQAQPTAAATLHPLEAGRQPSLESTLETDGMTNSLSSYRDKVPEQLQNR